MSIQLSPAGPWVRGQILTDADGFEYEAQDANIAKPYCKPFVVVGRPGPAGNAGADGADGQDGTNGTNGTNGVDGQDGTNGTNGTNGTDGADGQDGANGADGIDARIDCSTSANDRVVSFTTLDVDGADGPCNINLDDCCDDPDPIPDVMIVKSCTPAGPFLEGETVNYSFVVTNTGQEAISGSVTDNVHGAIGTFTALGVGQSTTLTLAYTVTAADVAAGTVPNIATVNATGDVSGTAVSDDDDHFFTTIECVTREVCGKVIAYEIDLDDPPKTSANANPASATWSYGGITLTMTYTNNAGVNPGSGPHCMTLFNAQNQSLDLTVSGMAALAFDDCPACLTVEPEIASLDGGTIFTTDQAYDVIFIQATDQNSPTEFEGNGTGEGEVVFETEVNSDGPVFSADFSGAQDNTQFCMHGIKLQLPVKVIEESCDGGNTWDFISATDGDGNTYAESEVDY